MSVLQIEVVDWGDPRAVALRDAMNAETGAMYAEFTAGSTDAERAAIDAALAVNPDDIAVTVVALDGDEVLGHSALRPFDEVLEVKKVFTTPSARGRGVARALLSWLEEYARQRNVTSLVLQTGPLQVAAIALYEEIGYYRIPAYGAYDVIPGAVCMRKAL